MAAQQQQQQNILNQQYQDYLTQKQNPYNQLSFMQSMLAGLPIGTTSTSAQPSGFGSFLSNLSDLGGFYGTLKGFGG